MAVNIIFKNKTAPQKAGLIKTINDLMEISSDRLFIFLASEDNQNNPNGKTDYDKMYDLQGFYADAREDAIPCPWPDEVNCILGKSYEYFIWISKRICESEDIHFAWIYSYELQHLRQSLNNPYLLIVAKLLDYVNYEIPSINIPTEYECEKKAKQTVISIFGEDNCNSYLRKRKFKAVRDNDRHNEKRYNKILELNIMANFDAEQEIQQAICTNKKALKVIQKQRQSNGNTNWNIDIDKLCSCKDSNKAIISAITKMA